MDNKRKLITCASYGGTGSSAITDLLKEFKNIKSMGDFEFCFLHEVDGVSDLQHYIVDDFHRLKTDEGFYRFLKLAYNLNSNFGYSKFFKDNSFYEISREYIDELKEVSWEGYWHQHRNRYNKFQRIKSFGMDELKLRLFRQVLGKFNPKFREFTPSFKTSTMTLSNISYDDFIHCTRKYTDRFINLFDKNNEYEFIALDQMIPPTNLNRYINYFNNIKVIVVDRDPRDLYILNKIYWKEGWIPTENLTTYIEWFKALRKNKEENKNALKINFEDLIYKYDETLKEILNFLDIDKKNHVYKKKYLNPEVSIKNTKLWEKHKDLDVDIKRIENELKEFCYSIEDN